MTQPTNGAASRAALAIAVMAAGVLTVCAAYAAGRAGVAGPAAHAAYWIGEAAIFAPPAMLALARKAPGDGVAAGLAVALATATYLVNYAYSPAFFTFPDALQHWRTLTNVLATHHVFHVNYLLPISSGYPGLEIDASALAQVTSISTFAAGLIVAGLAHLVFTAAIYALLRLVSGSPRIALGAVTVYATNPHYQVFDTIFGYQTLALAFFGLALVFARLATRHAATRREVVRYWLLAAASAAATIVTHHVTSFMLITSLALVAAVSAAFRQRPAALATSVFAAGCTAIFAIWAWRVAPTTISYLSPAASQLGNGIGSLVDGHPATSAGSTAVGAPLPFRIASYAVTLLIMAVIPAGWRQVWRTKRDDPWALALAAGSAIYYGCAILPLLAPNGSELAGRLFTFVYIPVGYTLATAFTARPPALRRQAAAAGATAVLLAGGLATGWPPWWEQLPGRYVVDGFESGITPQGIAAATWAGQQLNPGQRIAADYTNNVLLGSYGNLSPVNGVAELFCGPAWTATDAVIARQQDINYLVIDQRTASHVPETGSYFQGSAKSCPTPIPAADLAKFATTRGFDRIYDNGDIIVYRLTEAAYAP